jgi:hypothetical protein
MEVQIFHFLANVFYDNFAAFILTALNRFYVGILRKQQEVLGMTNLIEVFTVFLSWYRQVLRYYLALGHDHFLLYYFPIHYNHHIISNLTYNHCILQSIVK